MTDIANANSANRANANPVVKIGDRKKLQGTHHKYIVNELGEYTCNYCEKTSKNQSTISEHISRLHATEAGRIVKPFECPTCEKRFNSVSIRDQHIQNNHFNIRDSCVAPGCKYTGKSGSALCSHYARKHMDIDSMITMIDGEIAECNHCNKQLNKSSIIYHLARCNPVSPYCKSIQDSMRATANLGDEEEILSDGETELLVFGSKPLDLSNAKPADKMCCPFASEKIEKKTLIQVDSVFKKARKERTVRKPRKRILIIFEEIQEDDDGKEKELLNEKALYKRLKMEYNSKKAEYDSAEIKDKEVIKEANILKKMIEKSKQKIVDLKKK